MSDRRLRAGMVDRLGVESVYADYRQMVAAESGLVVAAPARDLSIPTGVDGLIGVRFVEAAVASHPADAAWVTMP